MIRLLALLLCLIGCAHAAGARRIALVVGANDGGDDRVRLRYAVTDAQALGGVLEELGGIEGRDLTRLAEPSRAALEGALTAAAERMSTLRGRVEFIFYYSGHSDERGLLLGGERLPYGELRRLIGAVPATVRIAIVDACASGALTRTKGGVRKAPFLLDESNAVAGSAILTSASADESAQESDRIRGSFFTHALLTGLRGAADRSGDGRVTLTEAYQFAYAETLARTESTRIGAQHPNYDLQLSGRGEVVLTDVRATAAGLTFAPEVGGRLSIRDPAGHLVAELNKPAGRAMELGLPAGRYTVHWHAPARTGLAQVDVPAGRRATLGVAQFSATDAPLHRARGGAAAPAGEKLALTVIGTGGALDGFELGLGNYRDGPVNGAQVGVLWSIAAADLDGAQVSSVFNRVGGLAEGAQVAGALNIAGRLDGAQVAGAVNLSEGVEGVQVAGAVNVAHGAVDGAQVAGAVNVAGEMEGAQVSGGVNLAEQLAGAQIGIINIAGHVSGAQIGIINVAESMDGAPIGLINAIGDGVHSLEVWSSEEHSMNLGLRLGSRHFQTILAVASDGFDTVRPGAGLGGRIELSRRLDLTIDVLAYGATYRDDGARIGEPELADLTARGRVAAGWRVGPVRVFAGPVARWTFEEQPTVLNPDGTASDSLLVKTRPGFVAGISLF